MQTFSQVQQTDIFKNLFSSITHQVIDCTKNKRNIVVNAANEDLTLLTLNQILPATPGRKLIIVPSGKEAELFSRSLNFFQHKVGTLEAQEFSTIFTQHFSEAIFFHNLKSLLNYFLDENFILVCPAETLFYLFPQFSFFQESKITLKREQILSPNTLASMLLDRGYQSLFSLDEAGSFYQKGEVIDILDIQGRLIRVSYYDDMIEDFTFLNKYNYQKIESPINGNLDIFASPYIFTKEPFSSSFKEKMAFVTINEKEKYLERKLILDKINNGQLFDGHPLYVGLFTPSTGILDLHKQFAPQVYLFNPIGIDHEIGQINDKIEQEFSSLELSPQYLINKNRSLFFTDNVSQFLNKNFSHIGFSAVDLYSTHDSYLRTNVNAESFYHYHIEQNGQIPLPKGERIVSLLTTVAKLHQSGFQIIFCYSRNETYQELKYYLDEVLKSNAQFKSIDFEKDFHPTRYAVNDSYIFKNAKTVILSESSLFAQKSQKSKAKKKSIISDDTFSQKLSELTVGDFVIHSEFGIGCYQGLTQIESNGIKTDFIIIKYKDGDKIYLPIYKINLIQKHSDHGTAATLNDLKTNKFQIVKQKAQQSVKKLAFDMMKLLAERSLSTAFQFSAPDHDTKAFELEFAFTETEDQAQAINEVIAGMQKTLPMDHLVCGDVGFGKTEVAMRAAFKAVQDKKQVAVLVPTTILAFQHFNSFLKRFKNFPVNIDFLSRFKSPKEEKEILENLKNGGIDILIGTHKILSEKVKFKDLGLVIVDEEQRFGVAHKEKLKLFKNSVHFLTLTATPIPRTLQQAFFGLRELSVIKTPPPRRQSIKSFVIKEDLLTLKHAIEKELVRGGQIFYVHNRIHDLETKAHEIVQMLPQVKVVIAHGQMNEKELEEKMTAFYQGKYDVLLSTTIIESGIDVPNANTMIIDRADTFGLSQLHQLRGRIGRSDKKAYCYFIIPSLRPVSEIAEKRLKALQTYADIGSGFSIASCDLEIRGAGNIIGADQSGHLDNIGLELFTELLQDAIAQLRGEKRVINRNIEIQVPFSAYIPQNYIKDNQERLKIYKRLSSCFDNIDLNEISQELEQRFGKIPEEMFNLLKTIEIRNNLKHISLLSLKVIGKIIVLQFDKAQLADNSDLRDQLLKIFLSDKKYQLSPDFKVQYEMPMLKNINDILDFSKYIAQHTAT